MPRQVKTWLVTGATRGIGREIAAAALARGANVVATGRRPENLAARLPEAEGRLLVLPLDVTNTAQVKDVAAAAEARFGRIDVLVNKMRASDNWVTSRPSPRHKSRVSLQRMCSA